MGREASRSGDEGTQVGTYAVGKDSIDASE